MILENIRAESTSVNVKFSAIKEFGLEVGFLYSYLWEEQKFNNGKIEWQKIKEDIHLNLIKKPGLLKKLVDSEFLKISKEDDDFLFYEINKELKDSYLKVPVQYISVIPLELQKKPVAKKEVKDFKTTISEVFDDILGKDMSEVLKTFIKDLIEATEEVNKKKTPARLKNILNTYLEIIPDLKEKVERINGLEYNQKYKESFLKFICMRTLYYPKRPITNLILTRIINQTKDFGEDNLIKALEQSSTSFWQDVFPKKEYKPRWQIEKEEQEKNEIEKARRDLAKIKQQEAENLSNKEILATEEQRSMLADQFRALATLTTQVY